MAELTAAAIAEITGGALTGDPDRRVARVAPLELAGDGDLAFVAHPRYAAYLHATEAGVVLIPSGYDGDVPERITRVAVDDPHIALSRVLPELYPPAPITPSVHPTAVVHSPAEIGDEVDIGPYAVIGEGSVLGRGTRVGAHAVIGAGCRIGPDSVIHPQATLYDGAVLGARCVIHSGARVGKEGFGFVWHEGAHRRIPQVGGCVLGDDVEVGCNTTIDRGSVGDTVIGAGTKIDNLVQVGHNVRVGKHAILISQVGIAGSTSIGDGAILAGQVGVAGHLTIGAGAKLAAQAGVIGDVPAGETWSGYPARPHREAMRSQGVFFKLPDLLRRVRQLEQAIFRK